MELLADSIVDWSRSGRLGSEFSVADIRVLASPTFADSYIRAVLAKYCEGRDYFKRGQRTRF